MSLVFTRVCVSLVRVNSQQQPDGLTSSVGQPSYVHHFLYRKTGVKLQINTQNNVHGAAADLKSGYWLPYLRYFAGDPVLQTASPASRKEATEQWRRQDLLRGGSQTIGCIHSVPQFLNTATILLSQLARRGKD